MSEPIIKNFGPYPDYPDRPHPQRVFLSSSADVAIYGGARGGGKTYCITIEPLRFAKHPQFNGVLFRRTYPEIYMAGGPWDTANAIYPWVGATSVSSTWTFPSGASLTYSHMSEEKDWKKWMGAQLPYIGFDQLESFTQEQFFSMLASNRDPSGLVKPYVRATANPEPGWLAEFLQWWWDEKTGYPIMERSGKLRWFVRINETLKWADSKEELKERYPTLIPRSVTFIPAFVSDNTELMKNDPVYLGNLQAQDKITQERWIHGNWKVKPSAGLIFNRAWFADKIIQELPAGSENWQWVRFWDLAATAPKEGKDPDWTSGVKIGTPDKKVFYVSHVRRFRKTPHENEKEIKLQANIDGYSVAIRMEEEGGASGTSLASHYQRNVLNGFGFKGVKNSKNKVVRAQGASAAAQAGNIYILKGDWNQEFIDELDAFQGLDEKNDQVDGLTGGYNALREGTGEWTEESLRQTSVGTNERTEGLQTRHYTPWKL